MGAGGVGEGAEDVEYGSDADFAAHRGGVAHGGVKGLGEHKADAAVADAPRYGFGGEVDAHAEGFQHIGGAAAAGGGAVAVLGDAQSGAGGHQRGGGGQVKGVGSVAAGAYRVCQRPVNAHFQGKLAHHGGHAGDFLGGFALEPQGGQQGAQLRRGGFPQHYPPHNRGGIIHSQRLAGYYRFDRFANFQVRCSKLPFNPSGAGLLRRTFTMENPIGGEAGIHHLLDGWSLHRIGRYKVLWFVQR